MNVIAKEPPERDVHVLKEQTSMVDNFEVASNASSDISESLRNQILGISFARRFKPQATSSSTDPENLAYVTANTFEIIPSKNSLHSFEVIPNKDSLQSFEVINKEDILTPEENLGTSSNKGEKDVIDDNKSQLSMKNSEVKPYTKIQTQTVGIQTVPTDTDCRCDWGDCNCSECNSCGLCASKKVGVPEETSETLSENYTESSAETIDVPKHSCCRCQCKSNWYDFETSSTTEQLSDNSEESYTTDFFDLPYQNNEEYLKLLRELEKKLIARNRERVRKTMLEFEKRSRQNQNLEKPIVDYSDDSASLLSHLKPAKSRNSPLCCKCGRNKKRVNHINSDIMQNEKRWDEMNFAPAKSEDPGSAHSKNSSRIDKSMNGSRTDKSSNNSRIERCMNGSRIERSMHKSHWQLDPRSGEWIKVSCFQQTDYARHRHPPPALGDYHEDDFKKATAPDVPPISMGKKECCCRQKKRR